MKRERDRQTDRQTEREGGETQTVRERERANPHIFSCTCSLVDEFVEELALYGHIYMYRFRPTQFSMRAHPIDEYPAQTQQGAAVMLMIMNNLDPAVAQVIRDTRRDPLRELFIGMPCAIQAIV